jgi:hypothetical protein
MVDFITAVDFIFKKKSDYKKMSDDEKEDVFFMVNRKFARKYPKHAKLFNTRSTTKSTALDLWYYFFIKERVINTPDWYWFKMNGKKDKSILSKDEKNFLISFYDITEHDIEFLLKYFKDDVEEEVKKYRKLNKKE